MYCSLAGKPSTAHNSALCAYLNDQEFEAVIKNKIVTHMVDSERKSQNEEVFQTQADDRLGDNSDTTFMDDETTTHAAYMIDVPIDQEIESCLEKGIVNEEAHQVADLHTVSTNNRQPLLCIGQVALGDEKTPASCLQDIGSTGTFITHRCARRLNMRRLRVITLMVRSMGAPKQIKTFVYLGKLYNYLEKDLKK